MYSRSVTSGLAQLGRRPSPRWPSDRRWNGTRGRRVPLSGLSTKQVRNRAGLRTWIRRSAARWDTERIVNVSIVDSSLELAQLREELDERSAAFESAPAGLVVAWAVERFGSKLAIACSFQEAVLIDIAVKVDPAIEVIFLDTGSHFPETLEYVESIRARYDLNLTVTTPVAGAEQWPCGTAQCCEFRKVRPLKQALVGKDAWVTGLKRVDAWTRRAAPIVSFDETLGQGQDQPHGHLDRAGCGRVRSRPPASPAPAGLPGLPLDRLCPHHPSGGRGRGSARRALVRLGQGRMRTSRLT